MYNKYGTTWTRFLPKLTQKKSRIGILGGFGKGSIKSALELQPGEFMQDVVEGRQALVNYLGGSFSNGIVGHCSCFGDGQTKQKIWLALAILLIYQGPYPPPKKTPKNLKRRFTHYY